MVPRAVILMSRMPNKLKQLTSGPMVFTLGIPDSLSYFNTDHTLGNTAIKMPPNPLADITFDISGVVSTIVVGWQNKSGIVAYLDDITSPITASNGLTKVDDDIQLGGVLTSDVFIDGDPLSTYGFYIGAFNYPVKKAELVAGVDYNLYGSLQLWEDKSQLIHYQSGGSSNVVCDSVGVSLNSDYYNLVIGQDTPNSTYFRDNRTGANQSGIEYFADYSTNYTLRSLIDKGYLDARIAGITPITASNGLTKVGDDIQWGGPLTDNIDINGYYGLDIGSQTIPLHHFNFAAGLGDYSRTSIFQLFEGVVLMAHNTSTVSNYFTADDSGAKMGSLFSEFRIGGNTPNSVVFEDARTGTNSRGIEYFSNYSANYTNRSLVDKEYVLTNISKVRTINVNFDNGTMPILIGDKTKIIIPENMTILSWTILSDTTGSITLDIWKSTYAAYPPTVADSIVASTPPNITSSNKNTSSTLTGWTTALSAGDVLIFTVSSNLTISNINVQLKCILP